MSFKKNLSISVVFTLLSATGVQAQSNAKDDKKTTTLPTTKIDPKLLKTSPQSTTILKNINKNKAVSPNIIVAPDMVVPTSGTPDYRAKDIMRCYGPAKKWQLNKLSQSVIDRPEVPDTATYSVMAWFDIGDGRGNRKGTCQWDDGGEWRTREHDPNNGITLEYYASIRGEPISRLTFTEDGKEDVQFNDRVMFETDRNMNFFRRVLSWPDQVMVWTEWQSRGNSAGFGRIYKVHHVNREYGYRFPTTAPY